ncbi:nucleotidyltransferase domain-containing protein [Desulfobacterales bacterium HSG2]|nr:nucleotidyltransferase domain-containing protein [Desulfobacterales bacterium HSG2]
MEKTDRISITSENFQALKDLKSRLLGAFGIEKMILYGSVARAEADRESDSDLLILTKQAMNRFERHRITDVVFEVNLLYGTNFSSLVVDRASWESGPVSVLPIREEIRRDGIII